MCGGEVDKVLCTVYSELIIEALEEGEVRVRFVDWGIMAILARDMMRKANMQELETVVGAVKCKLLGRYLLASTGKLEQCEYMVELWCVVMYKDIHMMTDSLSSPPLPTHEDMPGTVTNVARTEHLSGSVQQPLSLPWTSSWTSWTRSPPT